MVMAWNRGVSFGIFNNDGTWNALILSILNTLIRPILFVLTLPITVVTLGLFIFVLNGLLLWFVASFVAGFSIAGFWPAVFGAIVYSFISWAATSFILGDKKA